MKNIIQFSVLVPVTKLPYTFQEIEKRIYESLAEMDLIDINGVPPRFIKIDVKWENGNKWNPYLDTIGKK